MPMLRTPYELKTPAFRQSGAVFSSPHSGSAYSEAFLARTALGPLRIRSSEDAFVDELFASAEEFGAPILSAVLPRAQLDLNRDASDLDPAVISGIPRRAANPRVAVGLGVIPRVVSEGQQIMTGKISLGEAEALLNGYWHPYHDCLLRLLTESRDRFGMAVLYDCHSMPQDALLSGPGVWRRIPDIVLGDRFGTSCDAWLFDAVADAFRSAGFDVARNTPFAGGYITQAYGKPNLGTHAVQIEINRALYMDEARIERGRDFSRIVSLLRGVIGELCSLGVRKAGLAAE